MSASFAERHGAWTAEQEDAATRATAAMRDLGVVRFAFVDAHGVLRGKTLVAAEAARVLRDGVNATTTLLMKDLSGRTAFPVFTEAGGFGLPALRGAADMVMLPDPASFRVLPWAPHSGWLLCDLFLPDGQAMPLSSRGIMAKQVDALAARGMSFVAGVELECHIVRASGPAADGRPGERHLLNPGYQYLTELRYDEMDPLLEALRATLQGLGLPLRTLEVEFGPSQVELTFGPAAGLLPADQVVLIRSAVKQTCQRHGAHASFMCRPRLPNVVSSGWHLHQSLRDAAGTNLFAGAGPELLSPLGQRYMAGLLAHASAACAFTTPTVNGYRRYRPYTNAPTRACWAADNRGAMLRVIGRPDGSDPATRIENRAGEPGANPYLAMAAQIAAGLDGMDRALDPGPAATAPYDGEAVPLPQSLPAALDALRVDSCYAAAFGAFFVDYFVRLKQAEIDRFLAEVTEWEHTEYFELL